MKKWVIIGAAAFFVLLVLAFIGSHEEPPKPLPDYPDTIHELGEYYLDDKRSIVIREKDGEIQYLEVKSRGEDKKGIVKITYSHSAEIDVGLQQGWAIGFEGPDTVVIELGNGEVIRRQHGDMHIETTSDHGVVIKKPSDPPKIIFREEFEEIKERAVKVEDVECAKPMPESKGQQK